MKLNPESLARASSRHPWRVLIGWVVLVMACVNIAGLLLALGAERQREFATRAAMGATRKQLIRLLLTEHSLLTLCGGIVGARLAVTGTRLVVALSPPDIPRIDQVTVNVA